MQLQDLCSDDFQRLINLLRAYRDIRSDVQSSKDIFVTLRYHILSLLAPAVILIISSHCTKKVQDTWIKPRIILRLADGLQGEFRPGCVAFIKDSKYMVLSRHHSIKRLYTTYRGFAAWKAIASYKWESGLLLLYYATLSSVYPTGALSSSIWSYSEHYSSLRWYIYPVFQSYLQVSY